MSNADDFTEFLDVAMSAQTDRRVLLLDLNEVTFLAARGLDALAAAYSAAHSLGVELALIIDPAAPATRPLQFLSPDESPAVYSTLDAALADESAS